MQQVKYNKTQIIKHISCCASTPTCFDTKVSSSVSLTTTNDRKSYDPLLLLNLIY